MFEIYAFFVCKIFGPKIRSCKFFDKSQVCEGPRESVCRQQSAHPGQSGDGQEVFGGGGEGEGGRGGGLDQTSCKMLVWS